MSVGAHLAARAVESNAWVGERSLSFRPVKRALANEETRILHK